MAALTTDKIIDRAGPVMHDSPNGFPVKAATRIFKGALCVKDGAVAAPGRIATGLTPIGVARLHYDNTGGGDGAIWGEFDHGDFIFVNDPGDPITDADVGADCFIVDDQTVARTDGGGTRSRTGKVIKVNPTGITGVVVRIAAGL